MRFLQAATILQSASLFFRSSSSPQQQHFPPTAQAFAIINHKSKRHYYHNYHFVSPPPKITAASTPKSISSTALYNNNSPKSYFASLTNFAPMPPLTYQILTAQNATTTNTIINHYATSSTFIQFAAYEGSAILKRDEEDATKLDIGIKVAQSKGVIDPNFVPEEYITIDVLGKNPDEVADEILGIVRKSGEGGGAGGGGGVVVLCGLSGTGKGTTVSTLKHKLENEDNKHVVCWSNGNIFRSVTLLAATWCEQNVPNGEFNAELALTKENLQKFMTMLSFGKFNNDTYDTRICGLGLDYMVSEVQNTELKVPKVSKNIPTVAEVTQGEVILFAANAISKMGDDGIFVLLEGREQTVNYVRTPLRFTLTLSDMSLIGKRRAAQRLAAGVLSVVEEGASVDEIEKALDGQLALMVKEAT
jgi:cytidylate kinase